MKPTTKLTVLSILIIICGILLIAGGIYINRYEPILIGIIGMAMPIVHYSLKNSKVCKH